MRQYREWKVGDTCYWGKLKGKVMDIDEISDYPITCEFGEDFITRFTENGSYYQSYNDQSLSFLPNELCMPFEEASSLPPKYVVRAENETQAKVLREYFSKLYGRCIGGREGDYFHNPELVFISTPLCTTTSEASNEHTLINFVEWFNIVSVEDTTYPNIVVEESDPLSSIPKPIIKRMLHYQVKQGNPKNLEVFRLSLMAGRETGGFDWIDTNEGRFLWSQALIEDDYTPLLKAIKKERKLDKFKKNLLKMLK